MIYAADLKVGKTFLFKEKPYKVIKYTFQKIARGGGNVKVSVRNLEGGSLEEKTFSATHKLSEINTSKRPMQYLYKDDTTCFFMDPKTYEQVEVSLKVIAQQIKFVNKGDSVGILFWDEKPLSIDIPAQVTLTITETAPGVKGNSTTNIFKQAVLENGLKLKVPLFIKKGDRVKVDSKTKEYIERVR